MRTPHRIALSLLLGLSLASVTSAQVRDENSTDEVIVSEAASFRLQTIAEGFRVPWGIAFVSDEELLIGEREPGRLWRVGIETGERTEITGLPEMLRDDGISSGLFDVRLHPNYAQNGWIYIAYGIGTKDANGLGVSRIRIDGNRVTETETIFESHTRTARKWHFGGRLGFSGNHLFITTGDGYDFSAHAQDVGSHAGKVLRVMDDGSIPEDNPFVGRDGAMLEIWSLGVRNPQGMAIHPETGEPWLNEHGPQGGDEVNIARAGANYGWPIITYGEEYGGGPIGDGITRAEGMEQPRYYWVPSIAPSGASFYQGDAFPKWQGNMFGGALALTHINRLVVEGDRILHEERLLDDKGWRVRFVEPGPDGYLYFAVDDGMLMRLVPAD